MAQEVAEVVVVVEVLLVENVFLAKQEEIFPLQCWHSCCTTAREMVLERLKLKVVGRSKVKSPYVVCYGIGKGGLPISSPSTTLLLYWEENSQVEEVCIRKKTCCCNLLLSEVRSNPLHRLQPMPIS